MRKQKIYKKTQVDRPEFFIIYQPMPPRTAPATRARSAQAQ